MPTRPAISGLVTSVDFGSFLERTLPHNCRYFSETLVITTEDDSTTRSVAESCGARLIATDQFWNGGAAFNKAAGLNVGVRAADHEFIFCFDADVLLPTDLDRHLDNLNAEVLYGLSRLTAKPSTIDEWELRGAADDYAVGYAELFSRLASSFPGSFSEAFPTAGQYDIEFMHHWPVSQRTKLSPSPVKHLGVRKSAWSGFRRPVPDELWFPPAGPRFHVQEYSRNRTLLIIRMDRLPQVWELSIMKDAERHYVGSFRPEEYHSIEWSPRGNEATIWLEADGYLLTQHVPIIRRHSGNSPISIP